MVTLSSSPFSIVYANAAFLRLSGLPADRVIGCGFAAVAVSQTTKDDDPKPVLLSDCMLSSGSGNHQKVRFIPNEDKPNQEPLERYARVVPIVSKRPVHRSEVSNVTHFSVELLSDLNSNDELANSLSSLTNGAMSNIKRPRHSGDLAVGVMG